MTAAYSTALRNARLDAITTAIGSGGLLRIYDGTRPASGGTATTLLGTCTLATPPAPAASGGVLTFDPIGNGTAVAAGTATWFRIVTSGGTFVIDGGAGLSGSGMELIMSTTTIATGLIVVVSSLVITTGNA